jgi:hypothetical protein
MEVLASQVRIRQWTKASDHMASQVRDGATGRLRTAELGLLATLSPAMRAAHEYFDVTAYRHWGAAYPRAMAQRRVLARIYSSSAVLQHESLAEGPRKLHVIPGAAADDSLAVVVPLVPRSFKLPASASLPDGWVGQARQASVFFALEAPGVGDPAVQAEAVPGAT